MISLGNSAKAIRLIPNCRNFSVNGDYKDTLKAQNQLFARKFTSIGSEENGLRTTSRTPLQYISILKHILPRPLHQPNIVFIINAGLTEAIIGVLPTA